MEARNFVLAEGQSLLSQALPFIFTFGTPMTVRFIDRANARGISCIHRGVCRYLTVTPAPCIMRPLFLLCLGRMIDDGGGMRLVGGYATLGRATLLQSVVGCDNSNDAFLSRGRGANTTLRSTIGPEARIYATSNGSNRCREERERKARPSTFSRKLYHSADLSPS
jgi:hypothetical protein